MNWKLFKQTVFMNLYGLAKIPLVAYTTPRFVESTDHRFVIKVPLNWRTKNHLNTMYFGALAVGAELSVAAAAVGIIEESKERVDFLFKDFEAQFLKRAEGDVHFICEEVATVTDLVRRSFNTEERLEAKMSGYAIVPSVSNEPVMKYALTLSLRHRKKKK